MNYQKKEMFESDSEWGFFIDLETYSLNQRRSKSAPTDLTCSGSIKNYPVRESGKKFIPDKTLFTIPEKEKEIYNYHSYHNNYPINENENETNTHKTKYDSDEDEFIFTNEEKSEIIKEKIQFYATLGIFISGITFTTLLAYNKLI